METISAGRGQPVRERLLDAAYKLFTRQGIHRVGVDTIVAESGCAKASLYNNFVSKENLALAFLVKREQAWTRDWLEDSIQQLSADPCERLLGIFDVFDGWFQGDGFEGCSFINVLLESESGSALRKAAADQLANIREIIRKLAVEIGLADVDDFAQCMAHADEGFDRIGGRGQSQGSPTGAIRRAAGPRWMGAPQPVVAGAQHAVGRRQPYPGRNYCGPGLPTAVSENKVPA